MSFPSPDHSRRDITPDAPHTKTHSPDQMLSIVSNPNQISPKRTANFNGKKLNFKINPNQKFLLNSNLSSKTTLYPKKKNSESLPTYLYLPSKPAPSFRSHQTQYSNSYYPKNSIPQPENFKNVFGSKVNQKTDSVLRTNPIITISHTSLSQTNKIFDTRTLSKQSVVKNGPETEGSAQFWLLRPGLGGGMG